MSEKVEEEKIGQRKAIPKFYHTKVLKHLLISNSENFLAFFFFKLLNL